MVATDKLAHFAVGFTLSILGAYIDVTLNSRWGFWAVMLPVLAGLLKELWDSFHSDRHTPDKGDALATALGVVPAWVFYCTML